MTSIQTPAPTAATYRIIGQTDHRFQSAHSYRVDLPPGPSGLELHVRFQGEKTAAQTAMHFRVGMTDEFHGRVYTARECVTVGQS